MNSTCHVSEDLAVLAQAAAILKALHTKAFQVSDEQLGAVVGDLAELRALAGAQAVAYTAEAETRGVIEASQYSSTRAWIAGLAPHSRREATTIAKATRILRRPDVADAADAILTADVDLVTGVVSVAEYDKLAEHLQPDSRQLVLRQLLDVGADHGPSGVRQLVQTLLSGHGLDGAFDEHQDRCRKHISLSPGRETSSGIHEYDLKVDNEGKAVLEAAIGSLSAPRPDSTTGEPDIRPTSRRRGEALIEALRRSSAIKADTGATLLCPKAVLTITMTLDDLQQRVNAAVTSGGIGAGLLLGPDTARRIACDADVIPAVLGGPSGLLDEGRVRRLFSLTQRRALWLRDQHCTFPDCDAPANWCDAHHLIHWADGGPTDLDNAALLCPRHHTVVHRDGLAGTVVDGRVHWDERPGSYLPRRSPSAARSAPRRHPEPGGPSAGPARSSVGPPSKPVAGPALPKPRSSRDNEMGLANSSTSPPRSGRHSGPPQRR